MRAVGLGDMTAAQQEPDQVRVDALEPGLQLLGSPGRMLGAQLENTAAQSFGHGAGLEQRRAAQIGQRRFALRLVAFQPLIAGRAGDSEDPAQGRKTLLFALPSGDKCLPFVHGGLFLPRHRSALLMPFFLAPRTFSGVKDVSGLNCKPCVRFGPGSGTDTNVYDEQGHLVWQSRSASANYGYFYAPDGKLLSVFYLQTSSPQATSIVYHEIYFGGLLLGTTQAYVGGELSTLTDRLGSKNQTYAYGTDVPSQTPPATSSPVDFATYLNDSSTGFEYANQRWYAAGYGRFLTSDPHGISSKSLDPVSWNLYGYSGADPIDHYDPLGLDWWDPNRVRFTVILPRVSVSVELGHSDH